MMRTDYCGALREKDVGRTVTAAGWVQTKRDMGGVIFIDLKDREGTLQVVFNQQYLTPEDFTSAEKLRNQSVIQVTRQYPHSVSGDLQSPSPDWHYRTDGPKAGCPVAGKPAAV